MSQKARKSVARAAVACLRPRGASPVGALNRQIHRAPARHCAISQAAREGTAGGKSGRGDRWRGSASEISIRVLRHGAELTCSPKQGKHRRGERAAGCARFRTGRPSSRPKTRSHKWEIRFELARREPITRHDKKRGGPYRPGPPATPFGSHRPRVRADRSALGSGWRRRSRVHLVHVMGRSPRPVARRVALPPNVASM
jgi:hypothetical protein